MSKRLLSALLLGLAAIHCAHAAEETPADMAAEKTAQQLAAELKPSVVVITVQGRDGNRQGLGTGFVISADGLIATNLHVIGEARPVRVQTADGKELTVTAVHASDRALDLAVLKVDARDLTPLPLGDSAKLVAGQGVVAIGNPRGLKHSVVQGIVSGTREIDRRKMIQLAIPVEPGNSGGPVVDMAGRVVGIMTMKSAITDNLGFAVQIDALKPLLERPNTVPIARWLKIGTLNPDKWTTLFGASWTQRAGRIFVSGTGSEFGGRSLCLSKTAPPEVPYEVAVSVKFAGKSGAAGLVFHADGNEKHYGFYPSAGKLRLSRFDGGSVFEWKVLQEISSEHYREGEWNDLKVRVAKDKIVCYLNGHVVIESTDQELTSGSVGLAKFRDTEAEFRRFRVGKQLADDSLDPEQQAAIDAWIETLPELAATTPETLAPMADQALASASRLETKAAELERRAAELRRIASDARTQAVLRDLSATLDKTDDAGRFNLLRAALLLARLDDPELEISAYEEQVAQMASEIEKSLPDDADAAARRAALDRYLFQEQGFHGSRTEYYHPANSYVNRVLDEREGIPITLSLLYMELGRRIGIDIEGVGLPGHFVVRHVKGEDDAELIDVFDQGTTLARDDAARIVRQFAGQELTDDHLKASTPREILVRMLRNLLGLAQGKQDREAMLRYLQAVILLEPESARDRGLLAITRFETGRRDAAIADLEWFFEHQPEGIDLDDLRRMQDYFRTARPSPISR